MNTNTIIFPQEKNSDFYIAVVEARKEKVLKGITPKKVSYDKNWHWEVDCNTFNSEYFYSMFHEDFPKETEYVLAHIPPKENAPEQLSLMELMEKIGEVYSSINEVKQFNKRLYQTEGDVIDFNGNNYGKIIDANDSYNVLTFLLPKDSACTEDDLIDRRVKLTGNFFISKRGTICFRVTELTVIGDCTRIAEYKAWKQKFANKFYTAEDRKNQQYEREDFSKIGLIAKPNTSGYEDFMNNCSDAVRKTVELKEVPSLNIDNIIDAIEELNEEAECDYICIVRGGGSKESLHDFSNERLLEAIYESGIPIVTGIGHHDSNLLCDKVAEYPQDTPTKAAMFFNQVYRYHHSKKKIAPAPKECTQNKDYEELQEKYTQLYSKYFALYTENASLNDQIAALNEQIQELKAQLKPEKKGFWSKIFS